MTEQLSPNNPGCSRCEVMKFWWVMAIGRFDSVRLDDSLAVLQMHWFSFPAFGGDPIPVVRIRGSYQAG